MGTDIGSRSESEEYAELSFALMKALMTTLTGMLISTLFLALTKSELTVHPHTRRTWNKTQGSKLRLVGQKLP